MRIENIGFSPWFQEKFDTGSMKEFSPARVFSVDKNSYQVSDGTCVYTAELTGKLRFNADSPMDYPAVGDWVYVQLFKDQSLALIHDVFPRKTLLKRKIAGRKIELQLIAANIDYAMIIQSLDVDFNLRRLERYLVMVNESGIVPVVLLSKSDLVPSGEIESMISDIHGLMPGIRIISFNCIDESGLRSVQEALLPAMTFCLLGSSGVGKTTLINKLVDNELYETRAVREKDGKGRHTTTRRQLIALDNGAMIIDTPGMRELGSFDVEAGIADTFSEILELARQCRFKDCTHTNENDCAVQAALENGEISEERYRNYLKLKKESEFNDMSYLERREKDRKFSRHCKSVLKQIKKERR